ncbi:MAG: TolC family protein [Phycisphaeraceae bacterium]
MIFRRFTYTPLALLPAAVALAFATGCAGPLATEREAFDRWHQLDANRHRTATAIPSRPADDANGSADLPAAPTLDDYLQFAAAHHPGLAAAFHEWKAALERVPQARALMDPRLSYSYFVRESMTQQTAGLSQTLPWYDKLQARGDAAMAQAHAAERRFDAQFQQVRLAVKQAYAEYTYLARALAVLRENHRILEDLEAGAQARFEAGAVPYADVVRAGVAVEQAQDEVRSLEARRSPVMGRLNAALGRSADHTLPWPEPLPAPALSVDESQLLAQLAQQNPDLDALRYETASRRHAHRLARQNRIPDLTLGIEYMDMAPDDMRDQLAVMASINLPIWGGRLDAERAEALAAFGAATQRQAERRNELEAELRQVWYRYRDADRRAALFEQTLLPMSREALDATEAAYSSGETEFQALTQAQTALQTLQLTYERTVTDRFQALAELERLVGRSLSDERPAQ